MAVRKYSYQEYVQGSTVRKLDTAQENREYQTQQPLETPKRQGSRAHQTHQAQGWDMVSLLFMTAAIGVTLYVCVSYIQVQHNISTMSRQIALMESEICDLKNENDAAYNKIDTSTDLSYIYDVATKELGMIRAEQSQMMTYEIVKSDFVRQYGDIPEESISTLERAITKKNK